MTRLWLSLVPLLAASGLLTACGSSERSPNADLDGEGTASTVPCKDGTSQRCGITLAEQNGVITCYDGVQICRDGAWSSCMNGSTSKKVLNRQKLPISLGGLATTKAPYDPDPLDPECPLDANKCDPECRVYLEDPPDLTPTGGGPPVIPPIPDWSSPPSTASCGHELCDVDSSYLDASCHPCVASVCALEPACCVDAGTGTEWSQTCVDAVFTECTGGPTPPPPLGVCDFAAYGDQEIRFGNGGTGRPVIGARGTGTNTNPGGYDVYLETNCDVGPIYVQGSVNLRNGCTINGDVQAETNIFFESGATLKGDAIGGGTVEMRNNTTTEGNIQTPANVIVETATVEGNITAGSTVDLRGTTNVLMSVDAVGNISTNGSTARIYGDATVNAPSTIAAAITVDGTSNISGAVVAPAAPVVELPDLGAYRRDLTASCTTATSRPPLNVTSDRTITPGIYGNITVSAGVSLILQEGGSYVFNDIWFYGGGGPPAGGGRLMLAGSPRWDVSVCNQWQTDSWAAVYLNGTSTTPNPEDFVVYSARVSASGTDNGIQIGDNNQFDGMFIAPDSRIRLFNNYAGTAAFWGKTIYTDTGADITNIPKASCEAANLFGSAICDGSTALYTDGTTYANGDTVHYDGTIYECTVGGWCTLGGGFDGVSPGYWPGRAPNWTDAWVAVGTCPPPPDPTAAACPVSLTTPGTDPPQPATGCQTGRDCQLNSRCTNVDTSGSHSVCVTGAALDASADPCVALVCDANAACCSSTWDSTCVGLVESTCDVTCGSVTGVACEHDLCTEGTAVTAACSTDAADVCAEPGYAYCCDTATPDNWDAACIAKLYDLQGVPAVATPPAGESRCDYALMSAGAIAVFASAINGGDIGGGTGANNISIDWGVRPQISGDIYSQGTLNFASADVAGTARSVGTLSQSSSTFGSTPMGGVSSVPSPAIPTKTLSCPTGGSGLSVSTSQTIAPGNYGAVYLGGSATYTFQAGTYTMDSFIMDQQTKIQLPATGAVIIDVCGAVEMRQQMAAPGVTSGAEGLRFQVYSGGNITLGANGTYVGVYTSPTGTATLGADSTLYGWLQASAATTYQRATINANGATGNDCRTAGLDPVYPGTPACPVTTPLTTTVDQTGECVQNGTSYTDPNCGDADLAVDINCAQDTIPVCNHGATDVPAGEATLTFYPRAGNQFGVTSPDASWAVGTCDVTSVIPAGGCVDQVCPSALTNQDLTVMVNMNASATVSECSVLDNWGYYEEGRSCTTGTGGTLVETIEYEAICPDDYGPVWKWLYWDSTIPAGTAANVTFEGRTADAEADFAASPDPFILLGTATENPTDTQVCNAFDSCKVDLTSTLWPTGRPSQPDWLQMRITLNSDGTDSPTLRDWEIQYSCVPNQ